MKPRYVIRYSIWPAVEWWGVLSILALIPCFVLAAWNVIGGFAPSIVQTVEDLVGFALPTGEQWYAFFLVPLALLVLILSCVQGWWILRQKRRSVEFYEHRIVVKWGVFDKDSISYVFGAVYMVALTQTFKQRILGYGTLALDCAGNWTDFNKTAAHTDGTEGDTKPMTKKALKEYKKDQKRIAKARKKQRNPWNNSLENIVHPKRAKRFLESRISAEGLTNIIHN